MADTPPSPASGPAPRIAAALVILLVAGLSVMAVQHRGHPSLPRGRPAPVLRDQAAGIDLQALRGRPVLVEFFASWCEPCARIAAPAVAAVAKAHAADGLAVIGVALERPETRAGLPAFLAEHRIAWPVIVLPGGFDDPALASWGVRSIPALFLIASDGTIAEDGLEDATEQRTIANIERALAHLTAAAASSHTPTD